MTSPERSFLPAPGNQCNVNNQSASFVFTLATLYPGKSYSNVTLPGATGLFPGVNQMILSQLNQVTIPSGYFAPPASSVTPSIIVSTPAGAFQTDAVALSRNIEVGPVTTTPGTTIYYDMKSGLVVEATQVVDVFFVSGSSLIPVTLQLWATNVPMSSANLATTQANSASSPAYSISSSGSTSPSATARESTTFSPNGQSLIQVTFAAGIIAVSGVIVAYAIRRGTSKR